MKEYLKEIIILIIQILIFYILPFTAGPADTMGLVVLIIFSTLILSFILGIISKKRIKYLYPIIISIVFIPTVFIHYNETALIHSVWYLVISSIGLGFGQIIRLIIKKIK